MILSLSPEGDADKPHISQTYQIVSPIPDSIPGEAVSDVLATDPEPCQKAVDTVSRAMGRVAEIKMPVRGETLKIVLSITLPHLYNKRPFFVHPLSFDAPLPAAAGLFGIPA